MPDLVDGAGRKVALGVRLGRGGEGEVFEVVGSPDAAAKLLHPSRRQHGKAEKVRAMVEQPPAGAYDTIEGFPVLTWPRAVLTSPASKRDFQGYTMTRVRPRDFVPFFQLTTAARRKDLGGPPITWDRLVLLGMRLCHVVRTLHKFGYAVGDMNDRNVLVSRRLTPLFMDTDSFQVPKPGWGHFPSVVGDQLYWPPELLDVDLATHKGTRVPGDRYALGVLLFQLFMDGMRPYQARGSAVDGLESLVDKTRVGCYPWPSPRPGVLEPPAGAPDYQALPRAVRHAFERCFVAGHRHPHRRPSADDWYAILAKVRDEGFQACAVEARHVYGKRLGECPWCLDPNDPFDPSRGPARPQRRAVPAPTVLVKTKQPQRTKRRPGAPPQRPAPPKQVRTPVRSTLALKGATTTAPRSAQAVATTRSNPSAKQAAKPSATRREPPNRKRAQQTPALADRWPVRGLWVGALSLAFASPTLVLQAMPLGLEKKVITSVATILLLTVVGAAASLHWTRRRRVQLAASWLWLTAATAATLAVGAIELWGWLAYTTGAACLGLGLATFILLERGRPGAFRPVGVGLVHGAAGLPLAYLPILVLWAWTRL